MSKEQNSKPVETVNLDDFMVENVVTPFSKPIDPDHLETPPVEEEAKDEVKETPPSKKEEILNEEEEEVEEVEVEDEPKGTKVEASADDDGSFVPFYEEMFERLGLGKYDPEAHGFDDSLDGAADFIKTIVEANKRTAFASDEVAEFNDYVSNGGDPRKYLEVMYGSQGLEDLDITNEADQKKIVTESLRRKYPNKSLDWIESKVEKFEVSGILEDEAKDAYEELKEDLESQKKAMVEEQKAYKEQMEKQYQTKLQEIKKNIMESPTLNGFHIAPENKNKFYKYITERGKDGLTQYERELRENQEDALTMAYLKFMKFDANKAAASAKTEVIKDVKKKLSRFKNSNSSGRNTAHVREDGNSSNFDDFVIKL